MLLSHFLLDLQEAHQRQMKLGSFRMSPDPHYNDYGQLAFARSNAPFGSIVVPEKDGTDAVVLNGPLADVDTDSSIHHYAADCWDHNLVFT